jgi:hypothetical protein
VNKVANASTNAKGVNDLGVGILQLAETLKKVEQKRTEMIRSLDVDLLRPLAANVRNYERFASRFEKDYSRDHKLAVESIKEAEKESAKAGKKGAEALQQAIQTVNRRVKEMEELRKSRLREAIIEQRKRYCFFIMHFTTFFKTEQEMHDTGSRQVSTNFSTWLQLATSPDQLPSAVEELVETKQQTLLAIQNDDGNYGYSDMYADSGFDRSNSFSSNTFSEPDDTPTMSPPALPPKNIYATPPILPPKNVYQSQPVDNVIRPGCNARALYEYAGDANGGKLSFREGDVILVQEADGSGWCLGELRGAIGWFPENYVQRC